MDKIYALAIAVLAVGSALIALNAMPYVSGAAESVVLLFQFNAAANHEVTWTLLGSFASTSGSGTTCCGSRNLLFNCSAGSNGVCTWVNATVSGASGETQNKTDPILKADNTGNSNVNLNITASTNINTVSACLDLVVFYNTSSACTWTAMFNGSAAQDFNTSAIPIDTSYTPSEAALCFWFNANFSNCTGSVVQENFLFGNSSD